MEWVVEHPDKVKKYRKGSAEDVVEPSLDEVSLSTAIVAIEVLPVSEEEQASITALLANIKGVPSDTQTEVPSSETTIVPIDTDALTNADDIPDVPVNPDALSV